jgi:anaerobic ribonucleoside-triphosphate reductase
MKGEIIKTMLKLFYRFRPPCPQCPYRLGKVHTLTNPCPQCKSDDYSTYERFCGNVGSWPNEQRNTNGKSER